ncbi:MAG: hypothetical protein ACREEE_13430, partial [Dongiaceae bacterium]
VMVGHVSDADLLAAGPDPAARIDLELTPGDLAIWTLLTVHGSLPDRSGRDRCFMINSHVRAADSPVRGEWAFRDGIGAALGPEPEICRYEQLRERPDPFYIEQDWTGEAAAG